jgi:nucleoside-diphosphate-sugar epimerase
MENIKVLITGASGLIGLNLMKFFDENSNESVRYEIHVLSIRQIPEYCLVEFGGENVEFYREIGDINETFDLIFNCSGPSQPAIFTQNPGLVIEANIIQISKLHALLSPKGKFIQMSSSEIYSGCELRPCTEDHLGVMASSNPRRLYVRSKELAEILLEKYRTENQLVLIARVSLVYGPGSLLGDKRVLFEFINKALTGNLVIEGDASTIRRYLYVEDFLVMLNSILNKVSSGYQIVNFGGKEEITIGNLAKLIASLTGAELKSSLNIDNRSIGAPDEVWVSLDKFHSFETNFEPRKLREGLVPTISWSSNLMKSTLQLPLDPSR